jgi:tartrate-resistant acid phosphatase type 5
MGKIADELGSKMAIVAGDNFYYSGVTSVDDQRFKSTFEDVFTADSL